MSKATTAERALNRKGGTMSRLIKTLFGFYPVLLPLVVVGVVLCAIINSIGATFLQSALQIISESWQSGDWEAAEPKIAQLVTTLACIYGVGILSSLFWNRAMAIVTQGSLEKLREKMFNRMQDLPIRYFDTHQRGDIMSHYTNDIDTLRQMISQSLPNLLMTVIVIVTVFFIMLYYSVWMCLVIIAGVAFMTFMTKLLGSNSARFFIAQQTELGVVEGHIEEVMNGQKVVKAFCHESAAEADFDERNEKLFEVSQKANMYANILMPILMNLGNLLYVLGALAGGIFLALGVPNLSIRGMALNLEAANVGAFKVGGKSVGLNIQLPMEQRLNPYVTESESFHFFFSRKVMLAFASEVYVYFPGGFVTLDELLEIVKLIQTKKISRLPVVLYGRDFWEPFMQYAEKVLAGKYKTIDRDDLNILHIVDSVDEAYDYILANVDKATPRQI